MKRVLTRLLLVVVAVVCAVAIGAYWLLSRSLPQIDGVVVDNNISADVTIDRDQSGIPTIVAENRADLAYGTGFVHGQDRFFQMDLTRRNAAGELSEVVGAAALPIDRRHRFHRFRSRADLALSRLSVVESQVLQAYVDGVNAGLQSLGTKPFEYFLLGVEPQPWQKTDSLLAVYTMFMELNDETAARDIGRGLSQRSLPASAFAWLYPMGSKWDAPNVGNPAAVIAMPDPSEFSLNNIAIADLARSAREWREPLIPGSNNWAVSGRLTKSGRAIVANDMHLGITVPNVFYRARMRVSGANELDLNGVTLPGTPIVVAGSNGHVAWGNTNSYGDWTDAVIVREGKTPGTYRSPEGDQQYAVRMETIVVKDGEPETLAIRETIWGPVLEADADPEHTIAVSWIAHHVDGVSLGHLNLEETKTASAAMEVANTIGMPPQNFVVGDAAGNIGWTIAGKIPRRGDGDSELPMDWSESGAWEGWVAPADYPRILNPESGRIWTANSRVVDGVALDIVGDGGYDLGARTQQIRDALFAIDEYSPADMLVVQLDDRAIFMERWRDLLMQTLDAKALDDNAPRAQYLELVANWVPRASTESVGYRLVRAFRQEVADRVIKMVMQPVLQKYGDDARLRISNQFEAPLWTLVSQKPEHLLLAEYDDWDDFLLQSVDTNIEFYAENYDDGLENRTWGERNTAAIRHPLSSAVPYLARWLDMAADPLAGDSKMPRAQGPGFGASERFAVAPGDEENGYLHMPSGQSGHPLSEYYAAGHENWVKGRASPFLPGQARHTLTLQAGN
jgi:penicillin amidase